MSEVSVEMTGETVGEAKWAALRELERMRPGLDKALKTLKRGDACAYLTRVIAFGFFPLAASPSPGRGPTYLHVADMT